jgi:hypothetical protein
MPSFFKNVFMMLLLNSLPLSERNFLHFLHLFSIYFNALTTSLEYDVQIFHQTENSPVCGCITRYRGQL